MPQFQSRRSCRVALSVPIRVVGFDYRGIDFTEDAITVAVNLHGAKIRMAHQLLPGQEIRLFSHPTRQDAIFRVVSKAEQSDGKFTLWGVENMDPVQNIWGVDFPDLEQGVQLAVRILLQCPVCSVQENLRVDEALLTSLQQKGGIDRACSACHASGLWKLLPYQET